MRLFLLIFGFLITSEVYLLAAEAGMPQLDPTYWASQGFWLILIFTLLYLALSKLFIPKIKNSIDDRENRIKDDLDEAQKLKEVAEAKLKEYEISIENAKKGGKIAGKRNKELGIGIFALTTEQRSMNGKKISSQEWKCLETGYISSAAGLANYQREQRHPL